MEGTRHEKGWLGRASWSHNLGADPEGTRGGVLPSGETVFQAEGAAEAKTLMGDLALTSSIRNRRKVAVARAAWAEGENGGVRPGGTFRDSRSQGPSKPF